MRYKKRRPEMENETDWALITLAQTGSKAAFAELYSRHVGSVLAFVRSRVRSFHLAEDFTAETFLKALRCIDSVTYEGTGVRAWLITIAKHLVLDHVKSSRYRLEMTTHEMPDMGDSRDTPEQLIISADTTSRLLRHVGQLPQDQQRCIEMRFLREMPRAGVAVEMSRSDLAVRALQHRAIKKLAEMMEVAA